MSAAPAWLLLSPRRNFQELEMAPLPESPQQPAADFPAAGITNAMLADSKITLNANTAGGLTVPGAMTLGDTFTIGLIPCATSQVLQWSGTKWACATISGSGTITGVTAGTDLTGGG